MPHGPANAVLVAAPDHNHGPCGFDAGSAPICSGCPDRNRVMSGSGPFAPILNGVWQSLQPITLTRYLPRSIRFVAADALMPDHSVERPITIPTVTTART